MIKGIFFDWGFTLAHPEPDRDAQFYQSAKELGVLLPFDGLLRGIYEADNKVPEGAPPRFSKDKDKSPFLDWWDVLQSHIGGDLSRDVKLAITGAVCERVKKTQWVLYEDVIPTLEALKKRGLKLGIISNISIGIGRAGLEEILDIVVSANDIGVGKPDAKIFLEALHQANLNASEVIYVGDQYEVDVVGAQMIGIKAILIDRYDLNSPLEGCAYIRTLSELGEYLLDL